MTLTLHWWLLPLLICIAGVAWARKVDHSRLNKDGMFPDMAGGMILLGTMIACMALIIGHYL